MNAKPTRRQFVTTAAAGATLALSGLLRAQGDKPTIRILIGFPPGGATDAITRTVVDRLPALLGQPVIVDNRPGIGGRIAADALLAMPADGTAFMVAPNATPTFQMLVFRQQLKWDILRDFAPVASFASYPLGMAVTKSIDVNNVKEFVAWAKAHPDKASFGTPGLGGQNHFLGIALAKTAGITLTVVPYKGSPPMVTDLVGGQVPSAISLMDGMMAHHNAGRVRVIGIFQKERSPLMPEIPTFAEQGVNVTDGEGWTAMWAKAGTPPAQIERVQKAVAQILQQPEVRDTMIKTLWAYPRFIGGPEVAQKQRDELAYWEPIIRESGFKPE
jgi:tripartite-type tricarboxylate transporter receptor subunit TctC